MAAATGVPDWPSARAQGAGAVAAQGQRREYQEDDPGEHAHPERGVDPRAAGRHEERALAAQQVAAAKAPERELAAGHCDVARGRVEGSDRRPVLDRHARPLAGPTEVSGAAVLEAGDA